VYRYDPASGPAAGTILEQAAVPGGLTAVSYPARQAAEAESEASAQLAAAGERLVYVAVVSGGQGYLEPAYLFTGTAPVDGTTVPAQLLVPALAASAYR
jgi:hypothetical protein